MGFDGASTDVTQYLRGLAEDIDRAIDRYLPQTESYANTIREAMRYSVHGAGKRLRAALLTESAYICGGDRAQAIAAACAIEMVHAYSLIHDDLPCMDDDDMRRGKPSNHKVFGEGMAVLAGDALLTQAFHVLALLPQEIGISAQTSLAIIAEVASASGATGMIAGQVADLLAENHDPDSGLLDFIHLRKTGALFRASTRSGARLAGGTDEQLGRLTTFAHHFGVAFQIVDDLLDVKGDSSKLGKRVGSDERQGKLTYPRLYGLERSEQMATEHIAQADQVLRTFGERAETLRQLTGYVLSRQA